MPVASSLAVFEYRPRRRRSETRLVGSALDHAAESNVRVMGRAVIGSSTDAIGAKYRALRFEPRGQ